MPYVVKYTASDVDLMDDLRAIAASIEAGRLDAPGEGRMPLTRALMYVEESTGWEAWTESYLCGRDRVADMEAATRYDTAAEAEEDGADLRDFGEGCVVIEVTP